MTDEPAEGISPFRMFIIDSENEVRTKVGLAPIRWEDYPPEEEPPPPPDPFTLLAEIDCASIDPRIYQYDGWDPANGQGPRDTSMLTAESDEDGPFIRFRSEPCTEDVRVWNRSTKSMTTFPAGSYVSAGASAQSLATITYGAVEIEARATQPSNGTRIACLLWPTGHWFQDGEIDYAECSGDGDDRSRQVIGLNSHYADGDGKHQQHQLEHEVDWLVWRTIRVEWTPGLIRWLIDGTEVGLIAADVPTGPMYPAIQTALQSAGKDGKAREGTTPGGVDVRAWRIFTYTP